MGNITKWDIELMKVNAEYFAKVMPPNEYVLKLNLLYSMVKKDCIETNEEFRRIINFIIACSQIGDEEAKRLWLN